MLSFGAEEVISSCAKRGIAVISDNLNNCPYTTDKAYICVKTPTLIWNLPENAENYEIIKNEQTITLQCPGEAGAMYGLLDIAETIELFGFEAIANKSVTPLLEKRGVKYNMPFEPLEEGDATEKNKTAFLSKDYWQAFLDMMAKNRYNTLSLWGEHPYHMMFRLEKYPETCPYDDMELEWYKELFRFIFSHAKKRNIKIYIITWNIRLPGFAAKGLGLPEIIGNQTMYDNSGYEGRHDKLRSRIMTTVRQTLPIVQDYIKECIKALILEYPDLAGLGTNCAEEMVGNAAERQQWVEDAYVEALRETGRPISFIMRTNLGSGAIAEDFLDRCPGEDNYISWKYSVAHMYSSTRPRFEELNKIWDGIKNPKKLKVLFTVRNDDIHTFRWGDCDFVRDYMAGMAEKSYCKGYYWGCDGYLYGEDFQHDAHGHKTWKYDFEKHWQEFELLGRYGYELDIPEEIWRLKYVGRYGEQGRQFYEALKEASKIIPYVNRLHWLDIDARWHPESLLSRFGGIKNVIDTLYNPSMPLSGTVSIRDYAKLEASGEKAQGETPADIISALLDIEGKLDSFLGSVNPKDAAGEAECLLWDLHCWRQLCEFYRHRFTGALELARLELSGDELHREKAIAALRAEVPCWKLLGEYWGRHYISYMMIRTKHYFGYGLYLKDIERDQELAEVFGKVKLEPSDVFLKMGLISTQTEEFVSSKTDDETEKKA
jgi:hypothetical protein